MRLLPPDLHSRRSRFADWLELTALSSAAGQAPLSNIRTLVRVAADDRTSAKDFDIDGDDTGEPEVTERAADDLEYRAMEELEFRVKMVGTAYPFELVAKDSRGRAFILLRKATWETAETGELIYVFCLLDSGIRDGLLSSAGSDKELVKKIGNIFQICSCIAVGGYTNAEVVSLDSPGREARGF